MTRLLVCETYWRPIRLCALALAAQGEDTTLLLRGPLWPDVTPMIPSTPRIRWLVASKHAFRLRVAWYSAVQLALGRCDRVWVDKTQTARKLRCWLPWARARIAVVQADADAGFRIEGDPCGSR